LVEINYKHNKVLDIGRRRYLFEVLFYFLINKEAQRPKREKKLHRIEARSRNFGRWWVIKKHVVLL